MDDHLFEEISTRLDADADLDSEIRLLIDAALLDDLDAVAEGTAPQKPSPSPASHETPAERVYIGGIRVTGFRGVGPEARLDLTPGPGLTLVVGPNGTGKSSFAEGLELLLTGDNLRWSARKSKEWQSGFRNVHWASRPASHVALEADILVEGEPASRARRSWKQDDPIENDAFDLTLGEQRYDSVAEIGWNHSLQAYRPFLSYNEIGSILDQGPSTLFDTLHPILGLADLTEAADRLKARKKQLKDHEKEVKTRLKEIRAKLAEVDDERAKKVDKALAGRKWKLDVAEEIVVRDASAGEDSAVARLTHWMQIPGPDLDEVAGLTEELAEALKRLQDVRESESERARRLKALIDDALAFHAHAGEVDCPVCGNPDALDAAWAVEAAERAEKLRLDAEAAAEVRASVEVAFTRARALLTSPPRRLAEAEELGLDASIVRTAWTSWALLRDAAEERLVEELEARAVELETALEKLRADAAERRREVEREWRNLALEVHAWLPEAGTIMERADLAKRLDAAEKRLGLETEAIRAARFEPIKDRVFRYWEMLRARSSVEIADLALTGKRTRRKVEIDVAVDGAKAAALGVMSQGELHALALSLFLPRATMEQSPFGFLFIDDPVQAMDLARVDGLAQVLGEVARTHQTVVFTHDDRLPAAVRRLKIDARILRVDRSKDSIVDVRPVFDPVRQHLSDANALAKTPDLPIDVAARVVPGLCRQALEAACTEVVRRRRLGRGEMHDDVERLLLDNFKLNPLLALALVDDPSAVQEAWGRMKNRIDPRAVDIVKRCNRGAHQGWDGDLLSFVDDVRKVAIGLQGIA